MFHVSWGWGWGWGGGGGGGGAGRGEDLHSVIGYKPKHVVTYLFDVSCFTEVGVGGSGYRPCYR